MNWPVHSFSSLKWHSFSSLKWKLVFGGCWWKLPFNFEQRDADGVMGSGREKDWMFLSSPYYCCLFAFSLRLPRLLTSFRECCDWGFLSVFVENTVSAVRSCWGKGVGAQFEADLHSHGAGCMEREGLFSKCHTIVSLTAFLSPAAPDRRALGWGASWPEGSRGG